MELEELTDKYRALKIQMRYGIVAIVGLIPAIYLWTDVVEVQKERKVQVEADFQTEKQAFEDARQKAAELPALEAKLSEIELELAKAKEFLPDAIEIDSILAFMGNLEKELDVKLVKFTPGIETVGQVGNEYRELPVEIVMNGTFANTMRFMDRLIHMQSLTHMRNIQFSAPDASASTGMEKDALPADIVKRVDSQAKLILFKGA